MKRVFLLLLFACCLLVGAAAAAGGSGTAADPYNIETPAELQSIQNNLAAYYVLGNDIDMSGYSFTPIGSQTTPFIGSLDGNNYEISNLVISSTEYNTGLFRTIGSGATIKNIDFNQCVISSSERWMGIIAGTVIMSSSNHNVATFQNINILNSKITSTQRNTAALIGLIYTQANVNIINCDISNSIISQTNSGYNCGGLIGQYETGFNLEISDCDIVNTIIKTSNYIVGGILGSVNNANSDIIITDCVVSGCTISGDNYVGGFLGNNILLNDDILSLSDSVVLNSVIIGSGLSCGFVSNELQADSSCTISNCDIINTNIYGSLIHDISNDYTSSNTNTISGITYINGRYLYASGLTATPNGATVSYTLEGQQGSTTVEATQGTAQSWAWTFGDGATSTVSEDTTHTYAAPGTYSTSLTLKNYLDSTGVTVTTSGYNILPIPPTVSASANVLQLGQSTTLSAVGTLFSTIQWQYSTDSGATWQDISGATTATYEWTPTAGVYQVRAHVTAVGTGFSANSNVLSIGVYAPPTINAVTVSPTIGQYTQTITLSAEVTDTGTTPTTYQWQQSPEGQNTWTNIPGATTAQWIGQLTFAGPTDFRLIATGTGGQTISETVTYYIALPGEIQSLTATPSVVALPGSTTLSATGANVITWEWQELISGTWTTVGYGASLQESLTTEGTYTYRVLATGTDGTTITSETVEVLAGYAPTVSITSPANNADLPAGNSVTAQATVTGTDVVYQWSLGADGVGNLNTNPTTITYTSQGYKTITITAESIFGTATDSVTILYGKAPRPMQTELFEEVDTTPVTNFVNQFDVEPGEMPNPVGIVASLFAPFDDALKGFFWVLMFGAVMLVVWLISKNIAIPSVLGILFGSFMIGFMPDMYLYPAVALIAAGCAGGLVYVVRKN